MITFKDVSKIYLPDHIALNNINLTIQPKEFVSLAGPSGAGKSTLLRLAIREEQPSKGQIFLEEQEINHLAAKDLPQLRRKIGIVFQDFKLLSNKTAYENIAFAMEVGGRTNQEIEEDVPRVLRLVGLHDRDEHFPDQLSGGEKQRVAIGRALAHRPTILIADEPTGNLDLINTWDIIRLLLKINELGTTVILATHDREIVNTLDRRVITLEKGRVIRDEEKGRYIL
ncbi:MAG: cell division ATP-binding protein FtsE [Candidatus Portnoybacteria bacterium RIFCSPLOWO2_12_FULL_39_9]|uniref:Cell division ATP-binding protein FtsE n=1 Tax=Candidatus Portnoybacteria bacterium RIFCSPHIGHO2_12_FULL_38_9 TaxID=1801997 RepID=A0A1G2FF94_9BACT|nr:MAG: cell division ATP-binding protein FtsE [Candidatus Portnoybacteria bacterium RBG_13_40_8]OGZ36055.1 MAG: cell division ATP-binding protein FtsE [Candidatus Portnoybacteria bacterium RIFCSPHIGHO2_02_FULL_39_12]OGZ36744.1 MAG: cell division ATP-binding protein FtsE [Candidatus Portnoybacteria bacterium RIFCSPHIGHO2_12_FULL_38_9]OGZ38103.1 MAG: cell division ATP-binding protein FtsE [Candidatus Portnoybacteria bacterium RIFCSPLOWO2_01_FULL_38_39]OGZ40110.1 MAG: cell division ATP-binding pr